MASQAETPKETPLEELVRRAQAGERAALEEVVSSIQKDVYALALRFLWHPHDAEDATQEILVRIVTRLSTFEGRSRFRTWVYRVASNALLNMGPKASERRTVSFDEFEADLGRGLTDTPVETALGVEESLLLEEVKIGCTHAMLLCLDQKDRLAFILGEILEMDHREGSEVLELSPSTFPNDCPGPDGESRSS